MDGKEAVNSTNNRVARLPYGKLVVVQHYCEEATIYNSFVDGSYDRGGHLAQAGSSAGARRILHGGPMRVLGGKRR